MMSAAGYASLDLLQNGPSSFAALYRFLRREAGLDLGVEQAWESVRRLELHGLVEIGQLGPSGRFHSVDEASRRACVASYENWLGSLGRDELTVDAVSVDEVGLWCKLTEQGLIAARPEVGSDQPQWMVDLNTSANELVIHGSDERAARTALETWLQDNPEFRTEAIERPVVVEQFQLRGGGTVAPGVRMIVRLTAKPH